MSDPHSILTPEAIQMLIQSLTQSGQAHLSEIEMERFLNALTRTQSNVPTGIQRNVDPIDQ
jgi:hypothetical protein